jgi:trans-2,3-dihydro-3-hydroxyanthranilate isomerase
VARSRPDTGRWDAAFGNAGAFLFCGEPVAAQNAFHGRMYGQGMGIYEDPATGSAVAALAGLVAPTLRDGDHDLGIEQGFDMGRPSLIRLALTTRQGRLAAASIGGDAVIVSEGAIEA